MDFAPNPEIQLLRESVSRITAQFGPEYYLAECRANGRAEALWDALATNGFLGVNIPSEYGGAGLGISELMWVSEETAAQGCPLLLMLVSPAICGTILTRFGNPAQKAQFLPQLAEGKKMAFAITEPNAGSNSHQLETRARRVDGGYRLHGTKYYISGFDEADTVLVVAKTAGSADAPRSELGLFLVPTKSVGLRADLIPVEICAPEKQYTLFFDDVFVEDALMVGEPGQGLRQVFVGLQPERILGASISNGLGRYALERASIYANERKVWSVPIGSHQGVAFPLAQAKIHLELSRLMTQKAAWLYDHGGDAAETANIAKFAAAEAGIEALDAAIQTHGGNGLATEYKLAHLWGMARLLRTAPVSREMILNYVSQHSLKLPRSY